MYAHTTQGCGGWALYRIRGAAFLHNSIGLPRLKIDGFCSEAKHPFNMLYTVYTGPNSCEKVQNGNVCPSRLGGEDLFKKSLKVEQKNKNSIKQSINLVLRSFALLALKIF